LGRSWPAVKVIMFRARKRLLPLLGEFDGDSPGFRVSEKETAPLSVGRRPLAVNWEASDV
jgi:hypothetical protein